jgi:hypothetical protein
MTLKITLTIDEENEQGLVLVGLLTKALGRAEAGVSNLRIEREGEPVASKPKLSTVARLVAKREIDPPPRQVNLKKRHPPKPGTGAFLGLMAVASGVPNVNAVLKDEYRKHGMSADGAGATLSKLQARGYVRNVGMGEWKLTAKGEALLKEQGRHDEPKVEHDDRAND